MFKERKKAVTTMNIMNSIVHTPLIRISQKAFDKMHLIVDECKEEVGWLCSASKESNIISIHDTYLVEQDVHATTTEITSDGLSALGDELLALPNGVDIWNSLKVWGHSHVHMGVGPSGQDDAQMALFAGSGHEWFLRIIANKKGEMEFTLFDYTAGLIYKNVPWEADKLEGMEALEIEFERVTELLDKQLKAITEKMDNLEQAGMDEIKAPLMIEIKNKVKKMHYKPNIITTTYNRLNSNHNKNEKKNKVTEEEKTVNTAFTKFKQSQLFGERLEDKRDCYYFFDLKEMEEIGGLTRVAQKDVIEKTFPGDFDDIEKNIFIDEADKCYRVKCFDEAGQEEMNYMRGGV